MAGGVRGALKPPGAFGAESSLPGPAAGRTKVQRSADTSLEPESRVPHLIPNPCCSESKTPTWWEASQKV